ncbi:MAG: bifunctional (p)ppGpp synthetase/guanosine-3',5'-bis(diphosphate) 3'-pyrophosphohydrolase [Deltaproteobacteria bacterium]|nr:bifunctional (p)ppGpp synthetase/guanosine-3',5'-bis(diphosphate) 3'-pyrophosphohydrolase [Deltaproteobacteria bacterium]
MIRITDILEKAGQYLDETDIALIEKAYIFSASVHQGQVRLSGEPYLIHPLEVANMLVDMKLDAASIVTGLLHDTIEDTYVTIDEIREAFGKDVTFLVEGLTKISKITFGSKLERQAENFRKMMLAMSTDIRVLLIKLTDRIHNMRTLEYQPLENQQYIAQETLELYAPLANRLGINWMKMELEDLSFKFIHPEEYRRISEKVAQSTEKRIAYMEEVKSIIKGELDKFGLKGEVEGRAKHYYSILKKMQVQQIDVDEIYDLIAYRVILDSDKVKECYEVLSIIHALWRPVTGRFKDFIAVPKANHYQSLHTTVVGPYGERLEVQIRTREMHEWAEKGIASHWQYKEGKAVSAHDADQINRLRELLDIQDQYTNPREFMQNLKIALYSDEVYVFTPQGDVKAFPRGATPIDFAYSIHTDVGNHCIGAKVNRNIVPLKYQLQNGDIVEIIMQPGHNPSKDWLKFAVTQRALSKIRQWTKQEERERSVTLGQELLDKECKRQSVASTKVVKSPEFEDIIKEHGLQNTEDLYVLISYGKISPRHIVNRFLHHEEDRQDKEEEKIGLAERIKRKFKRPSGAAISITGIDDVMVRFAKCCSPLPGDEIVGFITRGRGVSVHEANCPKLSEFDHERIIDVHWNMEKEQIFPVNIRIICRDKTGLLSELSTAISALGVNITYVNLETQLNQTVRCDFQLEVNDLKQFKKIVTSLQKLKNVLTVERIRETLFKKDQT